MLLKPLERFRSENFDGRPPAARTIKKWPAAVKQGNRWFVDMDVLEQNDRLTELAETLIENPEVRRLLGGVP